MGNWIWSFQVEQSNDIKRAQFKNLAFNDLNYKAELHKCYFLNDHNQIHSKVPILLYFVGPKRPSKGQIKPKSRLASHRFSQKRTDEFDLFAVKSKIANKTNSSVHFWREYRRPFKKHIDHFNVFLKFT